MVVTKKNINVKGRNLLAGAGPQRDLIWRAGTIQNEFTTGSLSGNDSIYVLTKRIDLRKKIPLSTRDINRKPC
jgi:hypothetical protein